MIRMETTDIVIHKGEKEGKYQLYVEDYVMSYLKKYGVTDGRKIFFYGTREQKNKKYYIYGAGRQKNISYFVRYELLDEIMCRYDMDTPVFSIKEEAGRYELSGYYIFYQSNEAMQSYMIERKKEAEAEGKEQGKAKASSNTAQTRGGEQPDVAQLRGRGQSNVGQTRGGSKSNNLLSKSRPQDFSDIRMRSGLKRADGVRSQTDTDDIGNARTSVRNRKKNSEKLRGGIMAFQLSAVFLVLAAIIINSTNSYTKLRDLGRSAVEVFFTMENQEASRESNEETAKQPEGTILRLEDLDAEFEKENRAAKQEEAEGGNALEKDEANAGDEAETGEDEKDGANSIDETDEKGKNGVGAGGEDGKTSENTGSEDKADGDGKTSANADGRNKTDEDEKASTNADSRNKTDEGEKNSASTGGESKTDEDEKSGTDTGEKASQEAFARNFAEYYQIEKGDTLCNISIKVYGDASRVKEICEINKIDDPDNIKYGQKIFLP